jgi:hypothetical protein
MGNSAIDTHALAERLKAGVETPLSLSTIGTLMTLHRSDGWQAKAMHPWKSLLFPQLVGTFRVAAVKDPMLLALCTEWSPWDDSLHYEHVD